MNLKSSESLFLVSSFRFGRQIADIANCILFAKEHSTQTVETRDGTPKNWSPYRVVAPLPKHGEATTRSFLMDWASYGQITLIARTNVTLFSSMIQVISGTEPSKLPKVHILGNGDLSGKQGFKRAFEQIDHLLQLYSLDSSSTMLLPSGLFPDFDGVALTYVSFCADCDNRELSKYNVSRGLIAAYKDEVTRYISMFEEHVLNKTYPAHEANIVLTTCHCAKGLEWENVQVCDDFLDLRKFKAKKRDEKTSSCGDQWIFDLSWSNDEVNALYVACTRAKVRLSVPAKLAALFESFDDLKNLADTPKDERKESFHLPGKKALDVDSAIAVHDSLVVPLRSELGLRQKSTLLGSLLSLPQAHRDMPEASGLLEPASDETDSGDDTTPRASSFVAVTPDGRNLEPAMSETDRHIREQIAKGSLGLDSVAKRLFEQNEETILLQPPPKRRRWLDRITSARRRDRQGGMRRRLKSWLDSGKNAAEET
jgi:hypothetical protein